MLARYLNPLQEPVFALMRILTGFMFSIHGLQKVFGLFTDKQPPVGSQVWFGGIIELVCGVLISLGLFTRPAAFLASGTMAVAYAQFHWKGDLGARFFPAVNGGTGAALFSLLFLYIACRGAGRWSVDASLGHRG